jgi:DNA-binding NtrC family response regulator
MGQSVVLHEVDPKLAQSLAGGLGSHFAVHLTKSREELRDRLANQHAEAVVLNIEHCRLTDIQSLHQDFPALSIVCTHRVPDEEMWMAAMEAGAADVCPVDDVQNVLTSVRRSLSKVAAA